MGLLPTGVVHSGCPSPSRVSEPLTHSAWSPPPLLGFPLLPQRFLPFPPGAGAATLGRTTAAPSYPARDPADSCPAPDIPSPTPCTVSPGSNSPFRKPSAPGNPEGGKRRSEAGAAPEPRNPHPPYPAAPGTWLCAGLREDPGSQTTIPVTKTCRRALGEGLVGMGWGQHWGGQGDLLMERQEGADRQTDSEAA